MVTNSSPSSNKSSPVVLPSSITTDWVALLWRRKLIVLLVTAAVTGLGYLYYVQAIPIFQSSAQLLLIKNEANLPIAGVGGEVNYEDTISTHMILIKSPLIVQKAIAKHRLGSLPSLKVVRDPTAAIIQGLEAVRGGTRDAPDPNVINLEYRGVAPEDCAVILDAVVESYQEFLGDTYETFSDQSVQLIRQAKDELDRQLSEKEASYREFRQSSPHLFVGANGDKTSVHEVRIAEIERARGQQLLRNSELKARISSVESALSNGGSRQALTLLANRADSLQPNRTPRDSLEYQLFDSVLDEQLLLEDYGEQHPDVLAVRKKLAMLREHLGGVPTASNSEAADFLDTYLDSLRQELSVGEQQLEELNALFTQEQESAKSLASFQLADETFRKEIARTQQLFDSVINRLEEISLVKDQGGIKTQLISPPGMGVQVEPNLLITMAFTVALGLLLGATTGYATEVSDKRFRSPDDLRDQLGLPVVGHIPVIGQGITGLGWRRNGQRDASVDPSLCTFHQPNHIASEAYRAVRTALYFGTRSGGNKVVQVTSPTPGDGKTTLSSNLAVSVAKSGKKVMLIEADFRRPRLAKLFSLSDECGVSSVISGETDLDEAIQSTAVDNLDVMPCGPVPGNPSELLTTRRFQDLLDLVRERYDLVIVDTPPLLAVTDPSVVAPRVDSVLLVVSLGRNARDVALRAKETLENIGANVLGVVVNRFDKNVGYLSSGYGYGYDYGYRYGYRYRSDANTKPADIPGDPVGTPRLDALR